jgi:hypothetical protein
VTLPLHLFKSRRDFFSAMIEATLCEVRTLPLLCSD